MPARKGMSDQEKMFCEEYLQDYSAKNAALRVGYSPRTARHASEWIDSEHPTKPRLRAEIDRQMALLSKRAGINAERVLRELAAVAFADVSRIADIANGNFRTDADGMDTSAISSIAIRDTKHGQITEIRMADKTRALELIGKHLGMFAENLNITGAVPTIIDDVPAEPAKEEKNERIGFE